ncbi:hypothetical protein KKO72_14185 [Rhodoferax sp. U11-2br]|nr:hypothetical protein [Rhodoferax sp. U11-2br]
MKGTGQLVLFLDFDGVLHHENCLWHPKKGAYLVAPSRYSLFQHAESLVAELVPFPNLQIVLSTSWVVRYGFSATKKRLPDALQRRCIGATFHSRAMDKQTFLQTPRGEQVLADVSMRRPARWVALDDNFEGWPANVPWIQTDPYEGISGTGVLDKLRKVLWDMHNV